MLWNGLIACFKFVEVVVVFQKKVYEANLELEWKTNLFLSISHWIEIADMLEVFAGLIILSNAKLEAKLRGM